MKRARNARGVARCASSPCIQPKPKRRAQGARVAMPMRAHNARMRQPNSLSWRQHIQNARGTVPKRALTQRVISASIKQCAQRCVPMHM
eukprot:4354029-Pleurochrysis_carterae.AAC.3